MMFATTWTCFYTCHFIFSCEPLSAGSETILPLPVLYTQQPQLICWILPISDCTYFRFGANLRIRFLIPRPFTGIISSNRRLVRLEVRRRKWLLPPFVRTNLPEPVRRNLLAVALWVFNLYLVVFFFRGTAILLSDTKFRGVQA